MDNVIVTNSTKLCIVCFIETSIIDIFTEQPLCSDKCRIAYDKVLDQQIEEMQKG